MGRGVRACKLANDQAGEKTTTMATQTKPTRATRAARVQEAFDTLDALCVASEAAKDAPKPVQDFTNAIGKLIGYVENMNGSASDVVAALLDAGEDLPTRWQDTYSALQVIRGALSIKGEDVNRSAGDIKAKALRSMIEAEMLDETDVEPAQVLVERWAKSAPKKSGGSSGGSSTTPVAPLGFKVTVSCQKQGCAWHANTEQDNLNSIRRQAQVHSDKQHGQPMVSGQPLHAGITEALCTVGMKGKYETKAANAAEGGGFTVTRGGGS